MTYSEVLKYCCDAFEKNGIENYGNESRWLLESIDDGFMLKLRDEMPEEDMDEYFALAERRICGEPLQYLLGVWEFYGWDFFVGEGVLIPRPETEMLVEYGLDYLREKKNPVIIDLCAGSGCIGLTLASERPDAQVVLVEKYDEAFGYLEKNNGKLKLKNTKLIKGDIFEYEELNLPVADLIVSNPPYIETEECETLQSEVLREPITALDGGRDGLDFYRAILPICLKYCKGAAAFECGETQADSVENIFSDAGRVDSIIDFNGYRRVVTAERK